MLRVSFNLEEHNAFIRIIRGSDRLMRLPLLYMEIRTIERHYVLFFKHDFATPAMKTEYFDF